MRREDARASSVKMVWPNENDLEPDRGGAAHCGLNASCPGIERRLIELYRTGRIRWIGRLAVKADLVD
ncbi:MAG: hypothetical protein J2P52_08220 [Blastocatellia bacterium]|nr:hypothetical protein [Blastocatellia bacterium]